MTVISDVDVDFNSVASRCHIAAWICLYFWHHLFLEQLPFGVTLTSWGAGRNRSKNTCIHDVLNAAQAAQQVGCSHFTIWSKYWDTRYHQLTKMHFLHTPLWRGFSFGPPSTKAMNIGFTTAVQADDQCLCHVWTMCYHWPLHCGLLCTLAPNKILLGLHVVMVLLLYKLHRLTVSACVSKQQRNRDQEVVIVWYCWDLVWTSTLTLTPLPPSIHVHYNWTDLSPLLSVDVINGWPLRGRRKLTTFYSIKVIWQIVCV